MSKRTAKRNVPSLSVLPPGWRRVTASDYERIPRPDMSRMSPSWTEAQARAETEVWKKEAYSSLAVRERNKQWYYIKPREENDPDSPLSLWQRYQQIEDQAAHYTAGQRETLFAAAVECLQYGWPLPAWIRTLLVSGFSRYCSLEVRSLDEAFSVRRRTHLNARKTEKRLIEIFDVARQEGIFSDELPQRWKEALATKAGGSQANVRKYWEAYRKQIRERTAASAASQLAGWPRRPSTDDATKNGNS